MQNLINSDDYFVDLRGRDLNALDDDTLYLKEEAEAKLIDFITDEDYKAKRAQLNIDQQEMISLDKNVADWAQDLYNIYAFIKTRLAEANIQKSEAIMNEIIPLIEDINDMWNEVYKKAKSI